MGEGGRWIIGLMNLRKQCNSEATDLKKFKYYLSKAQLPYQVEFSDERRLAEQKVQFRKVPLTSIAGEESVVGPTPTS